MLTLKTTTEDAERRMIAALGKHLCSKRHVGENNRVGATFPCSDCHKTAVILAQPIARALVRAVCHTTRGDYRFRPTALEAIAIGHGFSVLENLCAHRKENDDGISTFEKLEGRRPRGARKGEEVEV